MKTTLTFLLVACAPGGGPTDTQPAAPIAPNEIRGALPVAFVRVEPPVMVEGGKAVDRAGLATALFELGLADLEAVVPHVLDLPPSPGLTDLILVDAEEWRARLELTVTPWELRVEVCDPEAVCQTHSSTLGSAEQPWFAVSALLSATSTRMLRSPIGGAREDWEAPVSLDPYAVLVTGRAAAAFYGMRPPTPDNAIGDSRRDPISRAVFIDPGIAVADWLLARREIALGNSVTGRSWLVRASLGRPSSLVLLADEAAALAAEGKPEAADRVWRSVLARSPDDLRFVAPTARAHLAENAFDDAAALLDGWPTEVLKDRSMASLRVALAEAGRELDRYDDLLATWQAADESNPEPVRRRVQIRVRGADYESALGLVDELGRRDAREEAVGLRVALNAALRRWDAAAVEATKAGRLEVALRLKARAELEQRPNAEPDALATDRTPEGRTAAGWARLRSGDAAGALTAANEAIAERKYSVDAIELRARAAQALAAPTARRAQDELTALRPQGSFVSPRTAAGATATAVQSQVP